MAVLRWLLSHLSELDRADAMRGVFGRLSEYDVAWGVPIPAIARVARRLAENFAPRPPIAHDEY